MRKICLTFGLCGVLSGVCFGQDEAAKKLSPVQAQALIQEWVKAERLASQEMRDWESQRVAMNDLLGLYAKEAEMLGEEAGKMGAVLETEDEDRVKLKAEVKTMRSERRALAKKVEGDAKRMLEISKRFPAPLHDEIAEALGTLDTVSGEKEVRDGLVALVTILKKAARFNRVVTVDEQMDVTADGKQRLLKVIYLGLGRAYYLSGDVGGVGVPGEDGWVWTERDGIAPRVREAFAIFNKTAQPGLVELPVEVAQ